MRARLLAVLLLASGCVVHATVPAEPPPAPAPLLSEQQAVDAAFAIARQRGLAVDRVTYARLDPKGRWHVELAGTGDHARLLLDGRDGRLLRGKFREQDRR
jgi:hypothetical protein